MRIRLDIAYKGTNYQGWQRQGHTEQTVQALLEKHLCEVMNSEIRLHASGRTDTGVHARRQVLHFDCSELGGRKLKYALNRLLPNDVVVLAAYEAPSDFHARFSAEKKEYRYYCYHDTQPDPFLADTAMYLKRPPDLAQLNAYAAQFVGEMDFSALQNTGTEVRSTKRQVEMAEWKKSEQLYEFRVIGNGFLKQMVRNMVGLQLAALEKEKNTAFIREILQAKSKQKAFRPAPACGLFLYELYYPSELDNRCRKI